MSGITPQAVAVDWLKQKLYWTNGATDAIERSKLDGTGRQTVMKGTNVRGMAVDPTTDNITTYVTFQSLDWYLVQLCTFLL